MIYNKDMSILRICVNRSIHQLKNRKIKIKIILFKNLIFCLQLKTCLQIKIFKKLNKSKKKQKKNKLKASNKILIFTIKISTKIR